MGPNHTFLFDYKLLILSLPHDHELHDIRISRYVLHDTLWNL